MKKISIMIVVIMLVLAMTGTCYAADTYIYGISDLSEESDYASSVDVSAVSSLFGNDATTMVKTVKDGDTDVYLGADKLKVTYTAAENGKQYVIFALKGNDTTPTKDNIVYINQVEAADDKAEFTIYQSDLVNGQTYSIYISSDASSGIKGITKVGTYKFNATGGVIDETKAKISMVRNQLHNDKVSETKNEAYNEVYDINGDGFINEVDVELIRAMG